MALRRDRTGAVVDGFRSAGYDVKMSATPGANEIVVQPVLIKFNYWSYSWVWPIFFEGDGIALDLETQKGDSAPLTKSYKAGSFWATPLGAFGFDGKIRGDMSEIVQKIHDDARSPEFRSAIGAK